MASTYPSNAPRPVSGGLSIPRAANSNIPGSTMRPPPAAANSNLPTISPVPQQQALQKLIRALTPLGRVLSVAEAIANGLNGQLAVSGKATTPITAPYGYTLTWDWGAHVSHGGSWPEAWYRPEIAHWRADTTLVENQKGSFTGSSYHSQASTGSTSPAHYVHWWEADFISAGVDRFYLRYSFHGTHGMGRTQPVAWPYRWIRPVEDPWYWPAADPSLLPITRPSPNPRPVPYPLVPRLPTHAPDGDPIRGPQPSPRPNPAPRPAPGPVTFPRQVARPVLSRVPYTAFEIYPRPLANTAASGRHPPGANTKERKFIITAGAVGVGFGFVTETLDLVDNIYENMPNTPRRKVTAAYKVRFIWDHFNTIDWQGAFNDWFIDQLTDAAIGKANKAANKAITNTPGYNRPVGIGTGPAF